MIHLAQALSKKPGLFLFLRRGVSGAKVVFPGDLGKGKRRELLANEIVFRPLGVGKEIRNLLRNESTKERYGQSPYTRKHINRHWGRDEIG